MKKFYNLVNHKPVYSATETTLRLETLNIETNVWFLVSDTGFSEIFFHCWRAGKIFSCQHLDLKMSQ